MGASAGIMMAGSTLSSSIANSEAERAKGEFQRDMSRLNADLADRQATDAVARGSEDASAARRKTKAVAGAQKTAMAAQGLDVSVGSPADAIAQTETVGAVEEMNIRTNAWREAWGYKMSGINERAQGDMAHIAGRHAARATLIAGGMQALAYGAGGYAKKDAPKQTQTREHTFRGNAQRATNRVD